MGGDHGILQGADPFFVRRVKGEVLPLRRILPQGLRHLRIQLLTGAHAVRRMVVQGDHQVLFMEPGQQLFRLRKLLPVPGIAGPAGAVFRVDLRHMPVHVQHGHGQRNALPPEAFHQFPVFLLGVGIIAAPPVPQREARRRRHRAGQRQEIPDRRLKIMPVGKKIQVFPIRAGRQQPSRGIHAHGGAVVQHGVAPEG